MSSITSASYFQLPTQTQNQNGGAASTTVASPTTTLLDALNSVQDTNNGGLPTDSVTLSSEAQNLLNAFNAGNNTSASSSSANSIPGTTSSFILTPKQQTQISDILAKYKDAPDTQATYNAIQDELTQAGLSATTLGQEDSAKSFNATQFFLDALNGQTSDVNLASPSSTAEQAKGTAYMQQVYKEWRSMTPDSTTASSAVAGASQTASS